MCDGTGGGVSFGSTVASLVELDRSGLTLDASALTGFLAMGLFPEGTSPYREVSKIAPGTLSVWTDQGNGVWNVDSVLTRPSGWPELTAQEALEDSVRAHLVSDVEVGVLLSGGVDSTLLAALASRVNPDIAPSASPTLRTRISMRLPWPATTRRCSAPDTSKCR